MIIGEPTKPFWLRLLPLITLFSTYLKAFWLELQWCTIWLSDIAHSKVLGDTIFVLHFFYSTYALLSNCYTFHLQMLLFLCPLHNLLCQHPWRRPSFGVLSVFSVFCLGLSWLSNIYHTFRTSKFLRCSTNLKNAQSNDFYPSWANLSSCSSFHSCVALPLLFQFR